MVAMLRLRTMQNVFLPLLAITVVSFSGLQNGRLKPLSISELAKAKGGDSGACYKCLSQDYCSSNTPCTSFGGGTYYYQTGTGITQKFCLDMVAYGQSGSGYKGCTADTYKDCMKTYSCTDSACKNCGAPAIEQKSTVCHFSGDSCTAGG